MTENPDMDKTTDNAIDGVDESIKCSMCGHSFRVDEAAHSCEGCALSGLTRCNRIRCPNCGFENVPMGGRDKGKGKGFLSRLFGRKR